jgi:hypothetical protein
MGTAVMDNLCCAMLTMIMIFGGQVAVVASIS